MRAENPAAIEGLLDLGICALLQALTDRPFRGGVVLRLHGAQCSDHVLGTRERAREQSLIDESQLEQAGCVHGGLMCAAF